MNQNPNPETSSASSSSTPLRQGPRREESARAGSAAGDEGRNLTRDAQQVASGLVDQATRSTERQFAGGKERAAQTIEQLAGVLRQTTEKLSSETDMPMVSEYLDRAASQVEGFSDYLQRNSLRDVVDDVERFARREPILFLGSAFLIGLLGGRFLRSSQPDRASVPGANTPQRRAGAGR